MLNPILYSCKFCTVLESLQTVHIIKVVPKIMSFVDVLRKLNSFSLESRLISTTNVASIMSLVFYFFFGVSLFSEFINYDGSNNIGKKNFKETPIN